MPPRFDTAHDLYAAFPTAETDVGVEGDQRPCRDFLKFLIDEENWNASVSFSAYLLTRLEAVAWGCVTLRKLLGEQTPRELAALEAAERWLVKPEEGVRRAALHLALETNASLPATWMAFAAGWSGGSIGPTEFPQLRAPPEQTARAVRTGLFIAMAKTKPAYMQPHLARVLNECLAQ